MAWSKDLVAASASPLILAILKEGDSYGYAIIQKVRELSGGELDWAEGMLYPILHRLEKRKLIEAYWGKSESGRRRKYYRLCTAGAEELRGQKRQWQAVQGMLGRLEGVGQDAERGGANHV